MRFHRRQSTNVGITPTKQITTQNKNEVLPIDSQPTFERRIVFHHTRTDFTP